MQKKKVMLGVLLVWAAGVVQAQMHAFELKDGRAVEAEIVDYNEPLHKVEVKLENGKRVKIDPAVFVEKDQDYIKAWAALDGFRNNSTFKISCDDKEVEDWKEEDSVFEYKYERIVYEVVLENKNETPLEKLSLEYRIFYEQEEHDNDKKAVATQQVKPGKLDLERVWGGETRTLTTESVVLKEFDFNSADYYFEDGDPASLDGDIKGIWLRLTLTTPEGLTAVRNVFEPSSIEGKYAW